jgi:hypothetical protein
MQALWDIFVTLMLTAIELIASAILLFPGAISAWVKRKARAVLARVPRPHWQVRREEARSWPQ